MLEKRIRITIIILIILMIFVGVAGTILYFTTDFLKSSEILFQKYIAQNINNIANVLDIEKEEQNIDLLNKSDYKETTTATLSYLESANDQEEIYNITEEGIIKNSENTSYRNIKAHYGEQELVNIDLLEQNNIYGFRLASLVQQFVSIENASVAYFVSSIGYEGQYFSETMKKVDISGLLVFSNEEIETLTSTYINLIFSDITEDHYSTTRNSVITLNNGQSVTTNAYSLTLTKNEFDNIYKKVINYAVNDEIILSKIDQIDAKIQEAGFNEPEGESLRELYIAKLQNISSNLNYQGTDERKIIFTVYEQNGTTVRTSIQTQENKIILDLDNTSGIELSLKTETLTNEGTSTNIYTLGKSNISGNKRTIGYTDDTQTALVTINTTEQESQMTTDIEFNYKNNKITNLSVKSNTNITFGTDEAIPIYFDETNNILLNNYEGDRVLSILDNLKGRAITSLENSQSIINTKLLNNIILLIDEREQRLAEEQQNNIELQKKRFNNQFILYEGEDVEYEYIQKLLQTAGKNMSDYQVISGTQIRLLIQDGIENTAKANEILTAMSNRYTYDIIINYSSEGYVETIDIHIHQDD